MSDRALPLADLRETGMLWLINKVVFHPRGFALAMVYHEGQFAYWVLQGDGSEPWRFDDDIDDEQFARAEATLRSARGDRS